MARSTDAAFPVKVHIDGTGTGTLTIEAPMPSGAVLVTYRPKGARRQYTVTLPEVAEMVCARAAKTGRVG